MDKKGTNAVIGILAIVLILGGALVIGSQSVGKIENFDDCVKAGNPVMESYPRQCAADGQTFVEDVRLPGYGFDDYQSNDYKFGFLYPTKFYLKENPNAGTAERPQLGLVLVEDTEENRDLLDGRSTEAREGPVSITITVDQNPENLLAKEWAENDTNWLISSKQLSPAEVGGLRGVSFDWDGLYQGRTVIVTRGNLAYIFSVTWLSPDDGMVDSFDDLLESVNFLE